MHQGGEYNALDVEKKRIVTSRKLKAGGRSERISFLSVDIKIGNLERNITHKIQKRREEGGEIEDQRDQNRKAEKAKWFLQMVFKSQDSVPSEENFVTFFLRGTD
jgi:hypothetical protein